MANIHEAKARLSELLEAAKTGEQVVICKHNRPIAELRVLAAARTEPRSLEPGAHRFDVPSSFFEDMPADFLDDIDGGSGSAYPQTKKATPSRTVASAPAYASKRERPRRR